MIQKLKTMLLPVGVVVLMLVPAVALVGTALAQPDLQNSLCAGANSLQVSPGPNGTVCNALPAN